MGKGYATEAAGAVLEYGFGPLGLERIVAVAYPANVASIAVMRKLGMQAQGMAHHYGGDLAKYGLERRDWLALQATHALGERPG